MVLLATMSAFFLDSLPIVGAGNRYTAEFTEAAGLKPGNEVRVAGVKVGKVSDVALDGDRVRVTFQTKTPGSATRRPHRSRSRPSSVRSTWRWTRGAPKSSTRVPASRSSAPRLRTTSSTPSVMPLRPSRTSTPPSWRPASRCCRSRSPAPRTRSVVRSTASPGCPRRWPSVIRN
ncbi:MCE family protein [Rhodococcus hoagii]|nr:MCE family protein [Prescottella equi]